MVDDDATARRTTKATTGSAAGRAAARKAAAPVKKAVRKATDAPKTVAPKKATAKKTAAKKPATEKTAAQKAPARKAPIKRTTTRDSGAILAPRKKAPPRLRLAAEETFDDDAWQQPEPEPVREDPSARMRAVLRAAARSLEEKEAGMPPPARPSPAPPPPPPPPPPPDEPVTRVLVAPEPEPQSAAEWLLEDAPDLAEEEDRPREDDAEDEWAPPEQLDDTRSFDAPPPPPSPPESPPAQPQQPPPPPIHRTPEAEVSVPPALRVAAEKKERKRRPILTVVLVFVVLLAVAGVVGFLFLRDEGIDYSKLKVGDCFDSAQSNEIRGIKVEPCTEPHNSEIFYLVTHPAEPEAPYPGKDALVQFAADACLGQPLTEYLGVPLEQSQLKDFEIVPQESAWNDGRRVLVCGVDTGDQGDITESVKGTRR